MRAIVFWTVCAIAVIWASVFGGLFWGLCTLCGFFAVAMLVDLARRMSWM